MNPPPILLTLGGLAVGTLLLGGLVFAASATPAPRTDFRPPCVASLGPALSKADVQIVARDAGAGLTIVGVDVSGSNATSADAQLSATLAFAATAPNTALGLLSVGAHSSASNATDVFLPGIPGLEVVRDPICPPQGCEARSLFEKTCVEQLDEALTRRESLLVADAQSQTDAAQSNRTHHAKRWRDAMQASPPASSTTLLSFWSKVAGLDALKGAQEETTVILLSDLVETNARAVRLLRKASRGPCEDLGDLPQLHGVHAVLLQTVERDDPEVWGTRWDALLTCAGARVSRHRWTPSLTLGDYLAPRASL